MKLEVHVRWLDTFLGALVVDLRCVVVVHGTYNVTCSEARERD